MPKRKKDDGINPWMILISLLTTILTGVGLYFILRDDDDASSGSATVEEQQETAWQSFIGGEGFFPDADGLFGTGWLSKIF